MLFCFGYEWTSAEHQTFRFAEFQSQETNWGISSSNVNLLIQTDQPSPSFYKSFTIAGYWIWGRLQITSVKPCYYLLRVTYIFSERFMRHFCLRYFVFVYGSTDCWKIIYKKCERKEKKLILIKHWITNIILIGHKIVRKSSKI